MSERLFLAIGFEADLCKRLNQDVKKVKINLDRAEIGYKWVPYENYHVTLVFLGDTEPESKQQIIEKIHELQDELSGFELFLSGVDAFDSEEHARVIYCGVQNKKSLRAMVDKIREKLGMSQDESYSPHLTLARLRNPQHVKDIISPVRRRDFFKVPVTEIRLYKSTLAGNYPAYKILERFPLQAAAPKPESE